VSRSRLQLAARLHLPRGKRFADLRRDEQSHGLQFALPLSGSRRTGQSTQLLPNSGRVTMVKFSIEDRLFIADAVRDVANLAAAGLLFGQLVVDRPFSVWIGLVGIML